MAIELSDVPGFTECLQYCRTEFTSGQSYA